MDPKSYAAYVPQTLREAFVAAVEDKDITSLREEIALLRTALLDFLQRQEGTINLADKKVVGRISTLVRDIRETIKTMSDIENRMRSYVHISVFPTVIHALCGVVKKFIADDLTLQRIAEEMGQVSLPKPELALNERK